MTLKNNGGPSSHEAAALTPPPTPQQYNADATALEQWMQWAEENGVIAVPLKLSEWVYTNAPHQSFSDRSLSVKLTGCNVLLKHIESGIEHVFSDTEAMGAASV